MNLRRFRLQRLIDGSGVSGVGFVAEAVQFSDGKCALNWCSDHPSIGIYNSIEELYLVHGHGGDTKVVWLDDAKGKPLKHKPRAEVISIHRKRAVGH